MLPDFYIIGAQKAGTTTLAALLKETKGIAISNPKEPMVFCFDDYEVHRNELLHEEAVWNKYRWDGDRERLMARYGDYFVGADNGALRGEASTTYALSRVAAGRIAEMTPGAKFIMILRDPVARAWSAYWHCVRKQIATRSFEHEIRFGGANLIEFGHYAEQLDRYRRLFSPEQVKVVHFEDLLAGPDAVLRDLLEFLGVKPPSGPLPKPQRLNESFYPRFVTLHRAAVALARPFSELAAHSSLAPPERGGGGRAPGGVRGLYRRVCMTGTIPGKMADATRNLLREHYRRVNAGLGEMLGEDIFGKWGW